MLAPDAALGQGTEPHRVALGGLLLLALIPGFGFQGSRGPWEPDEGRYTGWHVKCSHPAISWFRISTRGRT